MNTRAHTHTDQLSEQKVHRKGDIPEFKVDVSTSPTSIRMQGGILTFRAGSLPLLCSMNIYQNK